MTKEKAANLAANFWAIKKPSFEDSGLGVSDRERYCQLFLAKLPNIPPKKHHKFAGENCTNKGGIGRNSSSLYPHGGEIGRGLLSPQLTSRRDRSNG